MQVINRGRGVCSFSFGSYVKSPTVAGSENSGCTSSSRGPGSLFHCVICQGESTHGGIRRNGKPRRKYKVWGGVYP